ncbi:hypothetical protein GGE29_002396 [Agrobacterium tumefaciens]|nr:hypothetical protein [Agrobacterium radiobacter]MBB4449784.1 hypothetical protein [Agrobacterium radiobacter]MDR6590084.1 hypothetical protein [Agrobacterium tumefaciens]
MLRSIQPVRHDINIGDTIIWATDGKIALVLGDGGRRL